MANDANRRAPRHHGARRALGRAPWLWLLGLAACNSVLGIEDLHDGPRPGAAGDSTGATENTSGTDNAGGKSSGGSATGGKGSGGGMPGNLAGAGNEPSGGTTAMGGTTSTGGAGNDAGAGGATEPPTAGPVTGKVLDRWSVPIANVTVKIGTVEVSTDNQGVFTVPDVTATYDVSLLIDTIGDGWVYEGLTRRNPTLQVFQGHTSRSNSVKVTTTNATLLPDEQISLAIGTPTGSAEESNISVYDPPDNSTSTYPEWEGGTTTQSTFHGLKWLKDADTALPVTYRSYDSKPLTLTANISGTVTLDFTAKTITGKAITGTVTPIADPDAQGARTNSMFVRFGSGASIQVVEDNPTANAFSYVAPTLTDSTMTVAALEGTADGPMGLVHKDGLKPGDAAGALAIPQPPTVTPLPQYSNIDETTMFSFKGSPDNAGTFVVAFHNRDSGKNLYVVTTRKKVSIASLAGDWAFEHATMTDPPLEYSWWVETHGHFATVDEMTSSNGYVDEFSRYYTTPVALHQADGTYTFSAYYTFTTKNQ